MRKIFGWFFVLLPFIVILIYIIYETMITFGWKSALVPCGITIGILISVLFGLLLLLQKDK